MIITDAPQHHRFTWPIAAGLKVAHCNWSAARDRIRCGRVTCRPEGRLVAEPEAGGPPPQRHTKTADRGCPWSPSSLSPGFLTVFSSPPHTPAYPDLLPLELCCSQEQRSREKRHGTVAWRTAHTPVTCLPRPLALPTHEPNRSAALRNRPPSIRLSKVDSVRSFVCSAEAGKLPSLSEAPSRSLTRCTFCHSTCLLVV
jgi:hypothetical protein